jgi:rSAM/selenodomain-associated transferase 2
MSSPASDGADIVARPTVSIIIPALNEAPRLAALHRQLQAQAPGLEVILVDGGSGDGTPETALALGMRTLLSPRGRGQQLKAGAEAATGETLLFLHADSNLPAGAITRLIETLRDDPEIVGGNFRLMFDGDDGFSRWLNGFYRWIRSHGFYYGDSAVFVRRRVYEAIGGIRPIALMEDYDFVRRMEKFGRTCCIGDPPLITSSRRFEGRHPIAIVYGWLKIHLLFHLGASPDFLARLYDSERRKS